MSSLMKKLKIELFLGQFQKMGGFVTFSWIAGKKVGVCKFHWYGLLAQEPLRWPKYVDCEQQRDALQMLVHTTPIANRC
jgi:hypothetical protein